MPRVRRHPLPFLLRGDLRAQALLLLPQLGRELGAEVLRLEHLADLDLRILPHRIGAALDPFDRLFLRLHLPDPEAGDQLLGLGEGPVDDGALGSREPDARALRARVQPFAREHHAGLHQLLVELPHRGEELLVGHHPGFRILAGFDYDHESHRVLRWVGSGPPDGFRSDENLALSARRTRPGEIDSLNELLLVVDRLVGGRRRARRSCFHRPCFVSPAIRSARRSRVSLQPWFWPRPASPGGVVWRTVSFVLPPSSANVTVVRSSWPGRLSRIAVKTMRSFRTTSRYTPWNGLSSPSGPRITKRYAPPGRKSISRPGSVKPFGPHHLRMCSGSVHSFHMSSRGASKTRVRIISPACLPSTESFSDVPTICVAPSS